MTTEEAAPEERPRDPGASAPWLCNPISDDGVDLTQIAALARMTPTERVRLLARMVNRLRRLRAHVRRL